MKSYETTDNGGRVVCKEHGRIRCGDCAYVAELEAEVARLKAETERIYDKDSEFYSIALWCARRLGARIYAKRAYDDIEKVLGYEIKDRDWRGEQV